MVLAVQDRHEPPCRCGTTGMRTHPSLPTPSPRAELAPLANSSLGIAAEDVLASLGGSIAAFEAQCPRLLDGLLWVAKHFDFLPGVGSTVAAVLCPAAQVRRRGRAMHACSWDGIAGMPFGLPARCSTLFAGHCGGLARVLHGTRQVRPCLAVLLGCPAGLPGAAPVA